MMEENIFKEAELYLEENENSGKVSIYHALQALRILYQKVLQKVTKEKEDAKKVVYY